MELSASYLAYHNMNNIFLYNIENVIEFGFYFVFLTKALREVHPKTKSYYLAITIYLIISFGDIFFIQGRFNFHSYTFIMGCIAAIILCLQYFNYQLRFSKNIKFTQEPMFWIVIGILFYHLLILPVFAFYNFLVKIPNSITRILFIMVSYINIFFYIFLIIGFLCKRKLPKFRT